MAAKNKSCKDLGPPVQLFSMRTATSFGRGGKLMKCQENFAPKARRRRWNELTAKTCRLNFVAPRGAFGSAHTKWIKHWNRALLQILSRYFSGTIWPFIFVKREVCSRPVNLYGLSVTYFERGKNCDTPVMSMTATRSPELKALHI